ncbi:multidrug effflux MFS transporter [Stella sp.]|uniref:multidrug effflux MFS transporter n=1 Tax=Stella sp. TaxID=2912054 RepID=UPI0035B35BF3
MPRPSATPAPPGIVLLAGISAFGAVAIDSFLPLLPALVLTFAVGPADAQMAVGAVMIGFAVGQVLYGPLSDRFGRRLPLLCGIVLFTLSGAAAAAAESFETMVGWRFVQGLGGSAGSVIARAIVRDLHARDEAARQLSFMTTIMGTIPIVCSFLGAQLLAHAGWRTVPAAMAAYGLVLAVLVVRRLPETNRRDGRPPAPLSDLVRGYGQALAHRACIVHTATNIVLTTAFFVFLSASPFVLIGGGRVAAEAYGFVFALAIGGLMAGALLNGRLVRHFGAPLLMRRGKQALVGLAPLLALSGTEAAGLGGFLPVLFLFQTALSFVGINAIASALSDLPERAGTVSALIGAGQFAAGAVVGRWATAAIGHDLFQMTLLMAGFALLGIALHQVLAPGRPR